MVLLMQGTRHFLSFSYEDPLSGGPEVREEAREGSAVLPEAGFQIRTYSFHAGPDPDPGFQKFSDPNPDPGFEVFADPDPGLEFFQKLLFYVKKQPREF
jgi:hypothetical protein